MARGRPGSRGVGPGGAQRKAFRCGGRSAAARAARSPAASPSAFRIRWSNCSKKSSASSPPATSASRSRSSPAGISTSCGACAQRFPAIKLMADANSAYTLADADRLRQLDEFYLMMIEQPLGHDDIVDHAELQAQPPDAHLPGRMHPHRASCRAGYPPACVRNHQHQAGPRGRLSPRRSAFTMSAQAAGIPVWCGGMLEAGIGRAHNVALATLPNFVLPGDVSASRRYWARDIIQPPVETTPRRHHRGPRRTGLRLRARP